MELEVKMASKAPHRLPLWKSSPGWGDERFSLIEWLRLPLASGHALVLAGYPEYNFFVEASAPLGGGPGRIEAFWLCGKIDGRVDMFGVYPGQKKILRETRPAGQEWGGAATLGWQPGRRAQRQTFAVMR